MMLLRAPLALLLATAVLIIGASLIIVAAAITFHSVLLGERREQWGARLDRLRPRRHV